MTSTPSDPAELRAEIARTRSELGDTAAALAAKADVKARVKESAADTKQRAVAKVGATKQKAAVKADEVQTAVVAKAADLGNKAAEVGQTAAVKAGELRDKVASEAVTTKEQLQNGEVAAVARRPIPATVFAAAAVAIIGTVVLIIRRSRR
jgi:hypothetical protein